MLQAVAIFLAVVLLELMLQLYCEFSAKKLVLDFPFPFCFLILFILHVVVVVVFCFSLLGLICVNFIFRIVNSTCFNINEQHFMNKHIFSRLHSFCIVRFRGDCWKTSQCRRPHFIYVFFELKRRQFVLLWTSIICFILMIGLEKENKTSSV